MTLSVADFLQRWLQHVPAPQTRVVRYYGLYHHTHTEALALLPGPPGATARGRAGASGVADGVCPAGGRPSRAVSGLRAAAGVHRRHPARRCPAASPGEGVRRMRRPTTGAGRAWQGVVCLASARWWLGRSLRGGGGTLPGRGTRSPWPQTGRLMGDTGRRPAGSAGITSIAACASEQPASGRIGGRAVQPGVEADTWPLGVGCRGRGSVAARRSLTPNAFGFLFPNHVSKAACREWRVYRMMAHERILD